jgi:bacillithiol system protein YtxJ
MPANFIKLESADDLDRLIDTSHNRPVVIFKHSSSCGISSGVFNVVDGGVETDVHLVVVQKNRDISNLIASRTGIRHESPQAIVLHKGSPVYHASHWDIEPSDILEKIDR